MNLADQAMLAKPHSGGANRGCEISEKSVESPRAFYQAADTPFASAETGNFAAWTERAALIEAGASGPRAWAEGYARLDPSRPPGDVPARRWMQFVDDVGRFLDDGWAARAAALGWGPYDLFGCDADRPFACLDRAGLLWLLNGQRLVALTNDRAVIGTRTGGYQTCYRTNTRAGRMLSWELGHGVE